MVNTETGHWAGLNCQRLKQTHVHQACALSLEANWNQSAQDWTYMITHGHGWGLFDEAGRLVATALTMPQQQGEFGWISMVLVTRDWQRRGLARNLLEKCINSLLDQGLTPGLDATEFGRPIYLSLGFKDVYKLTRMACPRAVATPEKITHSIKAVQAKDLANILVHDQAATSCDRSDLLRHLCTRAPYLAWMCEDTAGHCFGRGGKNAHQIGPIISGHTDVAIALAATALQQIDGPVFVDVPDHQALFIEWLSSMGFKPKRSFTRMLHDRTQPYGDRAKIFAIAGPELG